MSLTKNLVAASSALPRAVVTWDRVIEINRNKEIWDNPDSVVHRLPLHYKRRYWQNVIAPRKPVHYRPPTCRFSWDTKRLVIHENEEYPIIGYSPPEADLGLWGGETVVKGYIESRPYTKKKVLPRRWVPHFFFPYLKFSVQYSDILDKYMKIVVTERACRLIDQHFGFDYYILETPDYDLRSKLATKLKRELLIALAKKEYYPDDPERHEYITKKYEKFAIPLEEAEWIGLDLNEACRKLQDMEDSEEPVPMKFQFEQELVDNIIAGIDKNEEEDERSSRSERFGHKLIEKLMRRK